MKLTKTDFKKLYDYMMANKLALMQEFGIGGKYITAVESMLEIANQLQTKEILSADREFEMYDIISELIGAKEWGRIVYNCASTHFKYIFDLMKKGEELITPP